MFDKTMAQEMENNQISQYAGIMTETRELTGS